MTISTDRGLAHAVATGDRVSVEAGAGGYRLKIECTAGAEGGGSEGNGGGMVVGFAAINADGSDFRWMGAGDASEYMRRTGAKTLQEAERLLLDDLAPPFGGKGGTGALGAVIPRWATPDQVRSTVEDEAVHRIADGEALWEGTLKDFITVILGRSPENLSSGARKSILKGLHGIAAVQVGGRGQLGSKVAVAWHAVAGAAGG